ncbi:hypothetical protein A9320_27725 [Ruegeria sp. PBVC088]|nr:hypothetical protein A9320_27725 [Ruegeria sp. PBVC088]
MAIPDAEIKKAFHLIQNRVTALEHVVTALIATDSALLRNAVESGIADPDLVATAFGRKAEETGIQGAGEDLLRQIAASYRDWSASDRRTHLSLVPSSEPNED